jgi:2'-5' RNA ligase
MRLFIAVPLPEPALGQAAATLRGLRELGWPVRWVREDNLHLTLKFFGEVISERAGAIEELLGFAVRGLKPMEMALAGGGVFPDPRRPRVLRLEIQAGPELELLQDRLERGGEEIGFPPEGRPFRPHVTLGRVREGHRLPADAIPRLEAVPSGTGFVADRIVLFESELSRAGPTYRVRQEHALA